MKLKECICINNKCYITNQKMTGNRPTGIVVHSTGANNKKLKRYVQPVKGQAGYDELMADLGKNSYGNHWNKASKKKLPHAFIGENDNGDVETYQVLPFDTCCWGIGKGKKGSYNYNPTARVQFEICEDNLSNQTYFNAVMKEAQEFCAYLCTKYSLGVETISSHRESYLAGYGSNHKDINHWLTKHGKDMDWFRKSVQELLDRANQPKEEPKEKPEVKPVAPQTTTMSEEIYVVKKGDTLAKIAAKYGTTHQKLAEYNTIANPNKITVGQKIRIPIVWTPAVGDIVIYNGDVHYSNANSTKAKKCRGGKAKIKKIYRLGKSKHPYLLVNVAGGNATVCGYVDAGTFTKA